MRTFLDTAIPPLFHGETVELRAIGRIAHDVRSTWHTSPATLIPQAGALSTAGYNVYLGVNPRRGKRRGDTHVSRVSSLAADIDEKLFAGDADTRNPLYEGFIEGFAYEQNSPPPEENGGFRVFAIQNRTPAHSACFDCPLKPTLAVYSGGGVQPYWILDESLDADLRDEWAVLSHRLARLVVGPNRTPDNVSNAERVLRLPGTRNWKYGAPRTVSLLWSDGPRYTAPALRAWLDKHAPWTAPPPPKPWTPPLPIDGVIDDFNQRFDMGALLIRHGALELRPARCYRRFAKAGQHTISATLDFHPGVLILQAQGFLGLDKERRHGYSAFAVYKHLDHGGDGSAAYRSAKSAGYGQRFGIRIDCSSSYAATRRLLAGTG
jgi:hypothetical protein